MKNIYVILLKNHDLRICFQKPVKKGRFIKEVRLFSISTDLPISELVDWINKKHQNDKIEEITDWE